MWCTGLASRNTFYSRDFNKALALMPVITAAIVLAMQSSIVISLGMVGALSIVRFRNAVKDPMDLVFLFWSISIGIVCGARLYSIAIIASLVVTVLVFLLDLVPAGKAPFLLVVNGSDPDVEHALEPVLHRFAKSCRVKSRNLTAQGVDLIVELRTSKEAQLVHACAAVPGVESVSLLAHDGEAGSEPCAYRFLLSSVRSIQANKSRPVFQTENRAAFVIVLYLAE